MLLSNNEKQTLFNHYVCATDFLIKLVESVVATRLLQYNVHHYNELIE